MFNRKCPTSLITQQIISGTGIVEILESVIGTLYDIYDIYDMIL